jgi:hypothetical protein
LKKFRYIWVAKWLWFEGSTTTLWCTFVSTSETLKKPVCVTQWERDEEDGIHSMLFIINKWEKEYEFVVVEHPNKYETPFTDRVSQQQVWAGF